MIAAARLSTTATASGALAAMAAADAAGFPQTLVGLLADPALLLLQACRPTLLRAIRRSVEARGACTGHDGRPPPKRGGARMEVVVSLVAGAATLAAVGWVFHRGIFAGGRTPDRSS